MLQKRTAWTREYYGLPGFGPLRPRRRCLGRERRRRAGATLWVLFFFQHSFLIAWTSKNSTRQHASDRPEVRRFGKARNLSASIHSLLTSRCAIDLVSCCQTWTFQIFYTINSKKNIQARTKLFYENMMLWLRLLCCLLFVKFRLLRIFVMLQN